MLGVYRPVEHIDNPRNNAPNTPDPQSIDKDFQSRATPEYFVVDSKKSMRRYIEYSSEFMQRKINDALASGPNAEGFRHLGSALHVLEDYFAHSNFVELSLREKGYRGVLPWTTKANCKREFPIVTGMFDSDDVIASTAGLIADTLFSVKWDFEASVPGKRTISEKMVEILLREHSNPQLLKTFQDCLRIRDKIATIPGHAVLERVLHNTLGMVNNAYNCVFAGLIHLVGNSVDDQQVVRLGDPNKKESLDPTHSQLAKDHDNHPFHLLAATLAKEAVRQVGVAMAARWWTNDSSADPVAVAAAFLVHPADTDWHDIYVSTWATTHPAQIRRGESATEWEALDKAHRKEAIDSIASVSKKYNSIWDYINKNYDIIFNGKNQVKK